MFFRKKKNALRKLYCSAKPSLSLETLCLVDCTSQAITLIKCNKCKELLKSKEHPFFSLHNDMMHDSCFLISN